MSRNDGLTTHNLKDGEELVGVKYNNTERVILFKKTSSPYEWKHQHVCVQALEEGYFEETRIGDISIYVASCCDSAYALRHTEPDEDHPFGVWWMGQIFRFPQAHMVIPVGALLDPVSRCTKWSDDGSEIVILW